MSYLVEKPKDRFSHDVDTYNYVLDNIFCNQIDMYSYK